jgi:hypothetical protein
LRPNFSSQNIWDSFFLPEYCTSYAHWTFRPIYTLHVYIGFKKIVCMHDNFRRNSLIWRHQKDILLQTYVSFTYNVGRYVPCFICT